MRPARFFSRARAARHLRSVSLSLALPLSPLHGRPRMGRVALAARAAGLLLAASGATAGAATLPQDLCDLLPAATVSKTLGTPYTAPQRSVAPRPFPGAVTGTDCLYKSSSHEIIFRIYADPSVSASTELFAKLKMFFGAHSTNVDGLGDEAYRDANHALHVRKGAVRFFLDGGRSDEKLRALANGVAGQL